MTQTRKVAVIVGSLRTQSYSRMTAKALCAAAPSQLECSYVEIGSLPLYNQDVEDAGAPVEWRTFREAV